MKVTDLTIQDWQRLLEKFKAAKSNTQAAMNIPAAMRIENTIFTTARYCGGMTMHGQMYTYFEPKDPTQPNSEARSRAEIARLQTRSGCIRGALKPNRGERFE